MITPKKSLGQNFLTDKNISSKIVDSLGICDGDLVLEIGPGMGALTGLLFEKNCKLIAVDADLRAIELLRKTYLRPNFELIHSDIREINLPELMKINNSNKIKIIGNIPYNISSDISFWLMENSELIESAIIMFQKEVAQRFAAKLRTKDYGILTVALNLVGSGKILFDVSPNCFYPKPEVTSSIFKFAFNDGKNENFTEIKEIVRAAFNQRRKTLRNALKNLLEIKTGKKIDEVAIELKNRGMDVLSKRAEELTADDFTKLNELLKSIISSKTA